MKLLKKLYRISSPSNNETEMLSFIKSLLKGANIPYTQDVKGNIYATKGDSDEYPCVVCHVDEVHKVRKSGYMVVETDGIIYGINSETMSYEGIGADDKNGIWVCLRALNDFDVVKCAFFVAEEVGCIGSNAADMKFFDDCRFVLQCDRKGSSDFITNASCTELCSDEFLKDANISQFGYKEEHGMMTDVMTLKENGLKVSACNISCGYYNPHSNNEMTRISDLLNCYELVKSIITNCTKVYPHEYTKPKYGKYYNYNRGYYRDFDWDYGYRSAYEVDEVLKHLRSLNPTYSNINGEYKYYDSKAKRYKVATKEDMYYAENYDKYSNLLYYYDTFKFDKDGNPIVKNYKEKSWYAPDKEILDEVLGLDDESRLAQYDEMYQQMCEYAMSDMDGFTLEQFKGIYGEHYPALTDDDYSMACEEIMGWVC